MGLKLQLDSLEGVAPEIAALYAKAEDGKFRLAVEGLEDTTGLKNALKNERTARENAEKLAKQFEGLDPVEIKALIAKFDDSEETKLVKEGKIDVVIQRRTEKQRLDFEKQIKAANDKAEAAVKRADKWTGKVLENHIQRAAAKAGIHPNAVDDAILRARSLFTVDDDGNAVQMQDGAVVLSKDGKTPYSPMEWIEGMREVAPHWFPASADGSGSQQSNGKDKNAGKKTITRSAFDQLGPKEKHDTALSGTVITDG